MDLGVIEKLLPAWPLGKWLLLQESVKKNRRQHAFDDHRGGTIEDEREGHDERSSGAPVLTNRFFMRLAQTKGTNLIDMVRFLQLRRAEVLALRVVALWKSMHDTGDFRLAVDDDHADAVLTG